MNRRTDKQRLNFMQKIKAIQWSYEEMNEAIFPDTWESEVVRVVIDKAMDAQEKVR